MGHPPHVNSDVLVAYGKAMREAQRLERCLWQLSVCHNVAVSVVKKRVVEPDEVEAAFGEYDGKTLGARVRRYRKELSGLGLPPLSQEASSKLDNALAVRNFLAHHFFDRHPGDDFASIPRCIKELPGDHKFHAGYLDNIKEPHPTAMTELSYAHDLFVENVSILGKWMSQLLEALGVRP